MERVYISSTVEDLRDYRAAVTEVLWKCGCDVLSMEKYPARDDRPREACEKDASACDLYVGVFAWRYGFIPAEDNPEAKSITELEYLAACRANKPRLIFTLDETFPWPPNLLDAQQPGGGARILDLRTRLKAERWASTFRTPDDLANKVMISIIQRRSTSRVEILPSTNLAHEFGPSYLPNIQSQISQPNLKFLALRLGPLPWWDTRLHLLSALASDFTELRQVAILDAEGSFITMTSPGEIRRALTNSSFRLEAFYNESRRQAKASGMYGIDGIISLYPEVVSTSCGGQQESDIKQEISPAFLRELGIRPQGEVAYLNGTERWANSDLIRRHAPYILIMRDGKLEGIVDRLELSSEIAEQLLKASQ